ncbi:endonuclease/exonuclease/phosphatase family protein [Nocardioides sp. 1609]|uniref:endonuclease/exonuclease/phosphatase family protein n=1 Tax=Nocardioides sp. 1609 TaxID=2508327 RepID=UPI00106F80BA|nr:endonuclease/exonuclease/phosphatase family protein [Nocardioides sp. 1609]
MEPKSWSAAPATVALVVMLVVGAFAVLVLAPDDDAPDAAATSPAGSVTSPVDPTTASTSVPPTTTPPADPQGTRTLQPTAPGDPQTVCVPQESSVDLRVVTYNIHSARPYEGGSRLARIGDEIARLEADVVLLQEVDRGRAWTYGVDMPVVLAERLGMSWVFGANVRRSPTNLYGTAILSRYPITDSVNIALPRPGSTQQRGLLHATIDVDGIATSFYNTHLEPGAPGAREAQMRLAMDTVRADPNPVFLGGDLNTSPSSPTLAPVRARLTDTWSVLGSGAGFTASSGNPRIRIDYLFFGSGTRGEVTPSTVRVVATRASDHLPLVADYRVSVDDGEVCVPVFPGDTP